MSPSARLVLRRALPWLACIAVACASARVQPSRVQAQPVGDVVVVPFGAPALDDAITASSTLEAELSRTTSTLISLHDARDRFTARSRPPQVASDSDLDLLARAARDAIEHVAFGRTSAAQKSVREVIARAELTLESLNRETATARQILDTCLSLVRSTLQSDKRDAALEQATRCRRLVPDLAPSEEAHPANVVGVLAEADNLLRRMRIGNLTVLSTPESNCSVYLNGRHLGTTPFRLDRAAAGDYRVQVECGQRNGRVHVVQLGDVPARIVVDTQFDRAVGSDPRLSLHYEGADAARAQALSHAVQLGRAVGASDVLLVGVHGDRAELLRVQVEQERLVARTSVPWTPKQGFPRPALERALLALGEGRIVGEPSIAPEAEPAEVTPPASVNAVPAVTALPPPAAATPAPAVETPAAPSRPASSPARRQRRLRGVGYGLLGAGAALFAVGVAYEVKTQQRQNDLTAYSREPELLMSDPAALARQQELQSEYERAGDLRWLGVGGGVLATGATALLVRPRTHVPWWSYALAGVGLGLVGVGGYEVANREECKLRLEDGRCHRSRDSGARGALLMSAAAPFLSVPVVHWMKRSPGGPTVQAFVHPRQGLQLGLHVLY